MIQEFLARQPNHISIEGMSYEDWLQKRREGIGGSDAGAIMGLSNFGSRLTVYLQKKGLGEKKSNAATRRGNLLEPIIRQIAQEDFITLRIEKIPYMFFSEKYPFMLANIDSIIRALEDTIIIDGKAVNGWGGHECKSSKSGYGFGDDEVPDDYYAQVQHYMAVLDLDWFLLSVYILETEEIRHHIILRNQQFIDELISQEKDFWENYYLKDNMPVAVGIESEEDMITGIFAGSEPLVLEGNLPDLCDEYNMCNKQIKMLENKKQAAKVNIMAGIVQQAKGNPAERKVSAFAGSFSISWITVYQKRVDNDALKKAGLYEKFCKETSYDRLTVTEKKGA
jgi:putative phage-type endonuclease